MVMNPMVRFVLKKNTQQIQDFVQGEVTPGTVDGSEILQPLEIFMKL